VLILGDLFRACRRTWGFCHLIWSDLSWENLFFPYTGMRWYMSSLFPHIAVSFFPDNSWDTHLFSFFCLPYCSSVTCFLGEYVWICINCFALVCLGQRRHNSEWSEFLMSYALLWMQGTLCQTTQLCVQQILLRGIWCVINLKANPKEPGSIEILNVLTWEDFQATSVGDCTSSHLA